MNTASKPGRKSTAELSVVVNVNNRPPLAPPASLTAKQAQVWRDTIATRPERLPRSAYPLAIALCRHVCRHDQLEEMISVASQSRYLAEDGGVERLNKLMIMAQRETKAVTSCARALRLTPQSHRNNRRISEKSISYYDRMREEPDDVG